MATGRIRIGDVWDSTLDAARGRARVIAPIALGAMFVPGLVANAIALSAGGLAGSTPLILNLVVVVLLLWGSLAIVAVVTDPATTRADAIWQANRRLLPALGNAALLGVVLVAAAMPMAVALAQAGINWGALQGPRPNIALALAPAQPGPVRFASYYAIGFAVFWLWLTSRAILTYAVALNERRGIGAIGRSFALTKGATARLMACFLLFAAVLQLANRLVVSIVAIAARLVLGAENAGWALLLGGLVGGLVSTALMALFCVFTGRLYVAAAGDAYKAYAEAPGRG